MSSCKTCSLASKGVEMLIGLVVAEKLHTIILKAILPAPAYFAGMPAQALLDYVPCSASATERGTALPVCFVGTDHLWGILSLNNPASHSVCPLSPIRVPV